MTATIKMIGLDPSLAHTGYVVVEVSASTRKIERVIEMGTINTAPTKNKQVRKSSDDLFRARTVATTLNEVIKRHGIKIATSEVPSGAQSASASRAFGIVVGLLASLPVPVIEVSPREVKLAIGTATIDKEDIVRWAVDFTKGHPVKWNTGKQKNEWEIELDGGYVTKTMEHQADALAGVQAAINSEQFRQLSGMMLALI